MDLRHVAATWARLGQVTFRRRQPKRSAPRVPGERLCRLTGETEKAPGFHLTLANIAVLLWYPSLAVLPLAYFSTTSAAIFTLSPLSVLKRTSTEPSDAMYFA